jgi:hypothetical protein
MALPVAFGVVRAASTGTDFRYLWVAAASVSGAAAVAMVGRGFGGGTSAAILLAAAAFLASTLAAMFAASWLGTSLGPGMLVVAAAFGFCSAVGSVLYARARS